LLPEPATLHSASFGIRTADSGLNVFLKHLLNRIHLSADTYEGKLDMSMCLDKFPNHQKGASQRTQSVNHGL